MFTVQEERTNEYLSPGIQSDIEIMNLQWDDGNGKYSPRIEITLSNKSGQTLTDSFSFSDSAKKYSEAKITHIWNSFYDPEQLKTIAENCGDDMEMFTNEIGRYLIGKVFTEFKVSGKEIQGKEGKNNWIKGCIGLPDFASGPMKQRSLKFDPKNSYDMNRLPSETPDMQVKTKW